MKIQKPSDWFKKQTKCRRDKKQQHQVHRDPQHDLSDRKTKSMIAQEQLVLRGLINNFVGFIQPIRSKKLLIDVSRCFTSIMAFELLRCVKDQEDWLYELLRRAMILR